MQEFARDAIYIGIFLFSGNPKYREKTWLHSARKLSNPHSYYGPNGSLFISYYFRTMNFGIRSEVFAMWASGYS